MTQLGKRIRDRRIALGLTQDEVCEATGYTNRSGLSKIENGVTSLPLSKIERMAKILGWSPAQLLGCTQSEYKVYMRIETLRAGLKEKE